jgi:hypothetical protein
MTDAGIRDAAIAVDSQESFDALVARLREETKWADRVIMQTIALYRAEARGETLE